MNEDDYMIRRTDFTRPYVRIEPNTDPKRALDFLYNNPKLGDSRHYGKPMAGDDGLVTTKQAATEVRLQQPQDSESRPGAGYCPDVASDWRRGMGPRRAVGRPSYDHGSQRKLAKSLGGDKDCWKSPFSAAHRSYGED
jgi:hypothetical protein